MQALLFILDALLYLFDDYVTSITVLPDPVMSKSAVGIWFETQRWG